MSMYVNLETDNPIADFVLRQCNENRRNYSIIIKGPTQTRKSTTGLKLACDIQKNFPEKMDTQLACVKTKKFIEAMRLQGLNRGDVLLFDEFGVGMSHRRWRELLTNGMNYLMMTHGFKGIVIIVTVPYESYVDSDAKKLFDMSIEMLGKDDDEQYSEALVEIMQHNQKKNKTFYHRLRAKTSDGRTVQVKTFYIAYPPDEVMQKYFTIANQSKDTLGDDIRTQARKAEIEDSKEGFDPDVYADRIARDPEPFIREWQGRKLIAVEGIMAQFPGIGLVRARVIKRIAERKLDNDAKIQCAAAVRLEGGSGRMVDAGENPAEASAPADAMGVRQETHRTKPPDQA